MMRRAVWFSRQTNTVWSFDHAPTSRWQPGEASESLIVFELPQDLTPGDYELRLVVYDDKTQTPTVQVGVWQPEATLARLQVKAGRPLTLNPLHSCSGLPRPRSARNLCGWCDRLHGGSSVKRRLHTPLVVLLLFLAVWVPRVLALDAFVTPDERLWLFRSANFYQAISRGDFAHTFQQEHPGVTVTWAGTLGFLQLLPGYAEEASGQLARDQLEPWLREHSTIAAAAVIGCRPLVDGPLDCADYRCRLLSTAQALWSADRGVGRTFYGLGPILHRTFAVTPPGRSACQSDRVCAARFSGLAARRPTASLFRHFRSRRGPGNAHQDPRRCFAAHRRAVAPA